MLWAGLLSVAISPISWLAFRLALHAYERAIGARTRCRSGKYGDESVDDSGLQEGLVVGRNGLIRQRSGYANCSM